jgi:beta-glucosidase-like glycosyl hydrolase
MYNDNILLENAYLSIYENIQDQTELGNLLRQEIRGHMPEFVSLEYINKAGEKARYTISTGVDYGVFKERTFEKLQDLKAELPQELKDKIQRVLNAKMQNGTLNLKKYEGIQLTPDVIDQLTQTALDALETSTIVALNKNQQFDDAQKQNEALYDTISKGIRVLKSTGSVKLVGIQHGKAEMDYSQSTRTESKSDPVVVIKGLLGTLLPKWRTFTLEPDQIHAMKISGNLLVIS